MLKGLRKKKTAKKIYIILAIFILPAFVFWGSESFIRNKEEAGFAGKIFGKKVSFLEYKDALDELRNQAIIQLGDSFSEMQKYLNLESQAWDRLILLSEARRRKITVSDKEVIELIESYPFFQSNGKFDYKKYSEVLQYVFQTQRRLFEEQTRRNLLLQKLFSQVTANIKVNEDEVKSEYRKLNEKIGLYYIASAPSDFKNVASPSKDELKEYFSKNKLRFKQPLSFNINYAVSESGNKIKALDLVLKKSGDFEKIVSEAGLSVKETGLFALNAPIPGIGWSPEILNLVAKFKEGETSTPIQLDKNYYIIRLKERKEAYLPKLEMVEDKVKELFLKDKSTQIAQDKIKECLEKLKEDRHSSPKTFDFQKKAKECGLRSDSTIPFKFGSYIEGVGASDDFWTAAQALKDEEFSEIIAVPSGFYIIKLKEKVPLDEQKFASEKDEFGQRALAQKKQEYFSKFLDELKRKAQ